MLWILLAVGSALFQVLRNMVMKRLGHALDETINVWGRFTFILPFAAITLVHDGVPPLTLSSYVEAVKQLEIVMALAIGYWVFREGARIRSIWLGCVVMMAGMVLLVLGR